MELLALPAESLGHRSATWFTNSGGQPLPEPVLAPGTDGDDTWQHQRVRRTHDVWHVVTGCPPSPAGKAALSAINVMQLRWPGSAMLLGAAGPEVERGLAEAAGGVAREVGDRCAGGTQSRRQRQGARLDVEFQDEGVAGGHGGCTSENPSHCHRVLTVSKRRTGTHDTTVGWYRSEQHAVRLALSSDGSEIQQVDNLHRRGNRNLCS